MASAIQEIDEMTRLPRDRAFDSSLDLLRDPFAFISDRCRRYGTEAFETRLALRPVICVTGMEGAERFYDERYFERRGVLPEPIRATVFGEGGVQMLDGEAHRHRKQMFRRIITAESVGRLSTIASAEWRAAGERWRGREQVQLYDEAKQVVARAVCAWAGVPLAESDAPRVARQLAALFEGVAALGPAHVMARLARRGLESWAAGLIEDVRARRLDPPAGSGLHVVAAHRALDGSLLSPRVAAVELLSVLRPTVGVAVFVVIGALALHRRPEWRARLASANDAELEAFAQEVRRVCRFAPFVAARVREDFTWQGLEFPRGRLVLLDLYGIDHDPQIWTSPDRFDPERFGGRAPGPFELVPQGGGADAWTTHRCPGESISVQLVTGALKFLTSELAYTVPDQDLRIPRRALPGLPRSRFVITEVRST